MVGAGLAPTLIRQARKAEKFKRPLVECLEALVFLGFSAIGKFLSFFGGQTPRPVVFFSRCREQRQKNQPTKNMRTLQVRKNKAGYEYRTDLMPWQYGGASFEAAVKSASVRVAFNKVIDLTEVTVELFATGRRFSMSRDCYDRSGPIGRVVAVDGQEILSDAPF